MPGDLYSDEVNSLEPSHELLKANSLVWSIFSQDERGIKLLEFWKKNILQAPVCEPGSPEGYGHWREGNNAFIRSIDVSIKEYENYEANVGASKK